MRRRVRLCLLAATAIATCCLAPGSAWGEDKGDLQAMIDATPSGGELRVPPGTYKAPVVVTRPIRILGEGLPVVDAAGAGHVFEVKAPDVHIEGLVIKSSGASLDHEDAGVSVRNSPRVQVVRNRLEDVLFGVFMNDSPGSLVHDNDIGSKSLEQARRGDTIRVYSSSHSTVTGNRVHGGRDAIVWFSDGVVVRDNVFTHGRYGVHLMYAHDNVIERNRFESNSVGMYLMYSHRSVVRENAVLSNTGPESVALGFKDCDGAEVQGNRLLGSRAGIHIDNSPFSPGVEIHYRENLIAYNEVGIALLPSVRHNVFTRNAIVDNRVQVALEGGGRTQGNRWDVDGIGNHWSDYAGFDANHDGIGDVEHRAQDLFGSMSDAHENLEFFADTPAVQAIEAAARSFPVLRPDPKAVDSAPLVESPEIPLAPGETGQGSALPLTVASLLMLGLAVVLVAASGDLRPPTRRRGPGLGVTSA